MDNWCLLTYLTYDLTFNLTYRQHLGIFLNFDAPLQKKAMNFIENLIITNNLQPADVIVLKKRLFGMLDHYAVFLGYDEWYNPVFVANYTSGTKRISNTEMMSFLRVLGPTRIQRFEGSIRQRNLAVERGISKLGERNYNFLENNCEHYANFVQYGRSHSSQASAFKESVSTAVPILFGALLIGALFSANE